MFRSPTQARCRAPFVQTFTFAAIVVFAVAACAGKDDSQAAPARQIELAPAKAATPQLADVPVPPPARKQAATKAPAKVLPAPVPQQQAAAVPKVESAPPVAAPAVVPAAPVAPPAPPTGTVAAGSALTLKPAARICTNTHRPGDRFTATLASPVSGSNGAEIPAGSVAVLRIVEAAKDVSRNDTVHLAFDVLSVRIGDETYEVNAHVTHSSPLERVSAQSTTDKVKKVGGGALIGAIAGRILGGNTKGAVIGGAVGAAAGAAVAAKDEQFNGCLRDDATITVALDRPLTVKLAAKP